MRNHNYAFVAMDFFTVPTASLRALYVLFLVEDGRRRVLDFNTTFNPSAAWLIQWLGKAFPYDTAREYLIFDRGAIFSPAVVDAVKAMGIEPHRTAYRSPWQNPMAERWIGSCRRELLEHVVVFGRRHLIRRHLMRLVAS